MSKLTFFDIHPEVTDHDQYKIGDFYLYRENDKHITYLFGKEKEVLFILGEKYALPNHFLNKAPFYKNRIVIRNCILSKKKTLYGIADLEGNIIIPPIYEELSYGVLGEKYITAAKNGRHSILDLDGNILIESKFDEVNHVRDWFHHGNYLKVGIDGKMGLLNAKLEEVVPMKYRDIVIFTKENTGFDEDEARLIDNTGNVVKFYLERGGSIKIKNKIIRQLYFNIL